jgi:hypothetical protein
MTAPADQKLSLQSACSSYTGQRAVMYRLQRLEQALLLCSASPMDQIRNVFDVRTASASKFEAESTIFDSQSIKL